MPKTKILALPGDEASVVAWLTAEALKREKRFSQDELTAYDYASRCSEIKERRSRNGGVWRCSYREPCQFCLWIRTL
jgi:hypothetical protein